MHARSPNRLVYLSPVSLDSFAQRPHHFVQWFHERFGAQVLWIDPGPSRLPRLSDARRLLRSAQSTGPLGPQWQQAQWLQRVRVQVLPIEPLSVGRLLNRLLWASLTRVVDNFVTPDTVLVMGKPCALALHLVRRYPQQLRIFDAMDSVPAFNTGISRQWMERAQTELAQEVDRIWASSHALLGLHQRHADKAMLALNALTDPPSLLPGSAKNSARPVLGYLGVIEPWFDWELVIALAKRHPEAEVRLVGPMRHVPPSDLPPNVRCLPPVAQHRVYEAMKEFDVGLIPFLRNDVTQYVDPVKYYEYRALGLPVLSTRFGEMAARGATDSVYFWDELDQSGHCLDSLLALKASEEERTVFCRTNTWAQRFEALVPGIELG